MSKVETKSCASSGRESLEVTKPRAWRMQNLALVVGATLVGLLITESFVRIFATQHESWLEIYRPHPTLATYALQPGIHKIVDTGETHWTCTTDAKGFRVSETARHSSDRDLVLCLGDSFTFGHGVDYEQSFVGRLDSDEEVPFDFLNAGVPGYGPVQYKEVLEYYLDQGLEPTHVVVTVFLGNDFFDCIWDKDLAVVDGAIAPRGSKVKGFLKRYSHLYRIVSKGYHILAQDWSTTDEVERRMIDPAEWESEELTRARQRFREAFAGISETCRRRNLALHVALIPMVLTVAEASEAEGAERDARYWLPNTYATEILSELGIDALDLTPLYFKQPIEKTFFAFDHHLTPIGHRIASGAMKRQWLSASTVAAHEVPQSIEVGSVEDMPDRSESESR